jgi:hypothetical protein
LNFLANIELANKVAQVSARDNPINFVDPSGLKPKVVTDPKTGAQYCPLDENGNPIEEEEEEEDNFDFWEFWKTFGLSVGLKPFPIDPISVPKAAEGLADIVKSRQETINDMNSAYNAIAESTGIPQRERLSEANPSNAPSHFD